MNRHGGHTLVELLVAISLMTIVVGVACGIWIASVRQGVARNLEHDTLLDDWLQERRRWKLEMDSSSVAPAGDSGLFRAEKDGLLKP